MRNRSFVLVAVWLIGTGFAMGMASFAVQLAGAGVTEGALPVMAQSDISAELQGGGSTGTSLMDLTAVATVLEPGETPGAPTPVSAGPATTVPAPAPGAAPGAGSPGASSTGSGSGAGSGTSSGSGTSGGSSSSGSSGSGSSGSGSGAAVTTAPPAPTTTVAPVVTQPIPANGGTVTVRCEGTTVSIVAANPNGGYVVDVRDPGPREVEVRFESKDNTSTVKASCSAGSVVPKVQESGKGG